MKQNNGNTLHFLMICSLLVLSILISYPVSSHPASDMSVQYLVKTNTLNVSLTHEVSDPNQHYIDNITIFVNNELFQTYNYSLQPSNSVFSYTYNIDLNDGDIIRVFSECNLGGSLTESLTINSDNTSTTDSGFSIRNLAYISVGGIPFIVYNGLLTLVLLTLTIVIQLLRKKEIISISVKWHIRIAYLALIFGIFHGILGLLLYV